MPCQTVYTILMIVFRQKWIIFAGREGDERVMSNQVMRYRESRRRSRQRRNRAIIVVVIVLLVALIAAGVYFLFFRDSAEPNDSGDSSSTVSVQSSEPETSSQKPASSEESKASSAASKVEEDASSAVSVPVVEDDPSITGRTVGSVFIYGDIGLEIFEGTPELADSYKKTIQKFADTLGDGVKVYNMVVPTHIEFALPERYQNVKTSEKAVIDSIYQSYNDNVTPINVYDILSQKRNEYIYFNTDHHWTALGAYYGYTEFAKTAGFEPVDINDLTKKTIPNFLGSLYSLANKDSALGNNPDHVDYYKIPGEQQMRIVETGKTTPLNVDMLAEFAEGSNAYSVFIWGDNKECVIKTDNRNGKKIAVVKESYGNAFIPFLAANYQEIHVIDSRYFPNNAVEYIKKNNIPEVLFINNIMSASAGIRVKEIENLMTK